VRLHPALLRRRIRSDRHRVDALVRERDRFAKHVDRSSFRRRGFDRVEDRLEREVRRFAPARVSAHPVAHDEDVTERGLAVADRVLVDLLLRIAPGIGLLAELESRGAPVTLRERR